MVVRDTKHTILRGGKDERGLLEFPEADREESRSEQKQLAYWEKEEVGMCLREAGKQDGRLYPATYLATGRLLPSTGTCGCVCLRVSPATTSNRPSTSAGTQHGTVARLKHPACTLRID